MFRCRTALHLEILALRHQLGVAQRSVRKPKLKPADRLLWVGLCALWSDWRSALVIVKPETVIGWHRKGFRLFWSWKVRRGRTGRPSVSIEVRDLIRKMSRENPLWGAPRIHGELLKLGIEVGETSVSTYMVRRRTPPSQTWRTSWRMTSSPCPSPGKRSGGTSHAPAAAARSTKSAAVPDARAPRPASAKLISVAFAHIIPVPANSI